MTEPAASTSAPRRARARRGEGEKLKTEILEAAERLLSETGDEAAVSIRAIADAVGVSPPAIYLHFADKDELLFELCEQRFGEFRERVHGALASHSDPIAALRAGGLAYIQFALENPEHYSILFMSKTPMPGDRPIEELSGYRAFMDLVEVVQRAVEQGRFRPVDPFVAAIGLWTGLHGLVSLQIAAKSDFPWPDQESLVDYILDWQLRGLVTESP
ncbi:MAG: TetR/AcrR family transcriptional regulator [Actinomycetota bacterium]